MSIALNNFFPFFVMSRWDTEALVDLPDYMKICYLAMFNFANEMAYDALRDHDLYILPYLKSQVKLACILDTLRKMNMCGHTLPKPIFHMTR